MLLYLVVCIAKHKALSRQHLRQDILCHNWAKWASVPFKRRVGVSKCVKKWGLMGHVLVSLSVCLLGCLFVWLFFFLVCS